MSLCEFKLKLAASLLPSGKSRGKKRKPSSNVTNAAYITKKKKKKKLGEQLSLFLTKT